LSASRIVAGDIAHRTPRLVDPSAAGRRLEMVISRLVPEDTSCPMIPWSTPPRSRSFLHDAATVWCGRPPDCGTDWNPVSVRRQARRARRRWMRPPAIARGMTGEGGGRVVAFAHDRAPLDSQRGALIAIHVAAAVTRQW